MCICFCPYQDALVIGAKFDSDPHGESCRLAFYGRVAKLLDPSKLLEMQQLRVYKVGSNLD